MEPRQLVQSWVDTFNNRADGNALADFYSEDAVKPPQVRHALITVDVSKVYRTIKPKPRRRSD